MPYITRIERIGIEKGRQESRQEGRQEAAADLVLRQLRRKLGKVDSEHESRLRRLDARRLAMLAEALLNFDSKDSLGAWFNRETIDSVSIDPSNGETT